MKDKNKERLNSIDLIRAVAIILVIIFHLAFEFEQTIQLRYIGFVGISLFFIVSGFVLAKNHPDQENFSVKWFLQRYLKIAPLYYLSLVMVVLLFSTQVFSGPVVKNLLYHFLFIDFISEQTIYSIISPAWFLIPLIGFYLLFPFLNRAMKKAPGLLLAVFILMIVFRLEKGTLTAFSPLFFAGEFCFGILVAHEKKHPMLFSAILTLFVMPIMTLPFLILYVIYYYNINPVSRFVVSFIGANTLAIFLFHESFMKVALGKWTIFSLNPILGLLILSLATFITMIISKYTEKMALSFQLFKENLSEIKTQAAVVALLLLFGIFAILLASAISSEPSLSPTEKVYEKNNIKILNVRSELIHSGTGCFSLIHGTIKNTGNEPLSKIFIECKEKTYPLTTSPLLRGSSSIENIARNEEKDFEIKISSDCNLRQFECNSY